MATISVNWLSFPMHNDVGIRGHTKRAKFCVDFGAIGEGAGDRSLCHPTVDALRDAAGDPGCEDVESAKYVNMSVDSDIKGGIRLTRWHTRATWSHVSGVHRVFSAAMHLAFPVLSRK